MSCLDTGGVEASVDSDNPLMCEQSNPRPPERDAVTEEATELDLAAIGDDALPWLEEQALFYAWSVLGAVAHATERMELMT